eukprot:tig00020816_g14157.t1
MEAPSVLGEVVDDARRALGFGEEDEESKKSRVIIRGEVLPRESFFGGAPKNTEPRFFHGGNFAHFAFFLAGGGYIVCGAQRFAQVLGNSALNAKPADVWNADAAVNRFSEARKQAAPWAWSRSIYLLRWGVCAGLVKHVVKFTGVARTSDPWNERGHWTVSGFLMGSLAGWPKREGAEWRRYGLTLQRGLLGAAVCYAYGAYESPDPATIPRIYKPMAGVPAPS